MYPLKSWQWTPTYYYWDTAICWQCVNMGDVLIGGTKTCGNGFSERWQTEAGWCWKGQRHYSCFSSWWSSNCMQLDPFLLNIKVDIYWLLYCWQVFSTLSFSGTALFSKLSRGFDVVVIDEAAQAVSSFNCYYIGTTLLLYFVLYTYLAELISLVWID